MNNNQPLNLLTTNNSQTTVNESPANDRSAHHQALNHLGDQRQMALASLFSSLSSLANNNNTNNQQQQTVALQQHHHHHHQQQIAASNHQQQIANTQQQIPPTSTPMATIPNSLQSVMAVAMMQQQLATAVSQHNQQQQKPQFIACDQGNFFNQGLENEQVQVGSQQQIQQRINYCTICNKELCNKYFMKTHMLKMHGINLEMEQPENDADDKAGGDDNDDDDDEKSDGDSDGRLDESNVSNGACSYEHRVQGEQVVNQHDGSWSSGNNRKSQPSGGMKKTSGQPNLGKSSPNNRKQASSSASKSQATSVLNGFAGNSMGGVVCDICNKELCSKYFLKVHKQNTHGIMTDYQDANQFMYPFANPMTAPNPFLAPATLAPPPPFTQNPLALFAGAQQPQQPQQCFDEPSISKSKSGSVKRLRLSQSTKQSTSPPVVNIETSDGRGGQDPGVGANNQFDSVYRLILAQQRQQQPSHIPPMASATVPPPPLMPMDPISANPLGALMCFGAMGPPGPFGQAGMSPAMIVDNILRNQHLFNRSNNNVAGSAMSQQQVGAAANKQTDRNNNNNSNSNSKTDSKQTGGKMSAKDSSTSNSRYFSHYTEACPMCDRRFKSIKWLKTHMMNDHKQEIGAYMQMMMQYLYTSKSHQMAAAATMAAFEQQQQQQHHQDLINHFAKNQQLQHNQPTSLLNKCFNPNTFQQQQQPNMLIDQSQIKHSNTTFPNHHPQQQPKISPKDPSPSEFTVKGQNQHGAASNQAREFAIDARCRQESLSPGGGDRLIRQLSVSPTSRSQLGIVGFGVMDNHSNCGLNFDLERLNEHHHPAVVVGGDGPENFILSRNSRAHSDILDENTGDSERSGDDGEGTGTGGNCQSSNQSAQQIQQIKTTTS